MKRIVCRLTFQAAAALTFFLHWTVSWTQSESVAPPPERVIHFIPGSWVFQARLDRWGQRQWDSSDPKWKLIDAKGKIWDAIIPAGMQCHLSLDGDQSQQFASNQDLAGSEIDYDHDRRIALSLKSLSDLPVLGVQYLDLMYVYGRTNTFRLEKILNALKNQKAFFGMTLGASNIDSNDLKPLLDHPTFQYLCLYRTPVTGSLFAAIKGHPGLEHVDLIEGISNFAREESYFSGVEAMPSLKWLSIEGADFTSAKDMAEIGKSTSLTTLTLERCDGIDRDALMKLQPLENLNSLTVTGRRLDLTGQRGIFDSIGRMPKLRRLNLNSTNTRDQDVPAIAAMRNLRQIDLQDTDATPAGIEKLRAARPDLEVIY